MGGQQTPTDRLFERGTIFEGKYRIVRELGRGGFGMVYLAYQEKMDRHVAIKVLKAGASQLHSSAAERFLREVKIISKLRHPNTVTIHDFGEAANEMLYMVLEYIEGETFKQILRREGAQPPRRALALVSQIARSLAEAHRHGVIHRDLKPANIMVTDLETEADFVKVLDFGIARLLRTDERDLTQVQLPDGERELIGTPRYMSPEQVRGESLSPASDVYSVGLILYELLVGEPAVQGDTTMGLISQQISPEPLEMQGLRALPASISELIRRATAKPLDGRFEDAERFADAIDQALADLGGAPAGSAAARHVSRRGGNLDAEFERAPARQVEASAPVLQRQGEPWGGGDDSGPERATQADLAAQAESPFLDNSYPEQEDDSLSEFGPDLPPPPGDTNPFAVPEAQEEEGDEEVSDAPDEDSTELVLQGMRVSLFGLLAAAGLYVSFMVVSAVVGQVLTGSLKLMAALILAAAIPLLTALGENSRRERLDVVRDPYDRLVRVFVGTAILSFGTAVLCALAMSGTVAHELRSNPNWFMGQAQSRSTVGHLNMRMSFSVADIIEQSTDAIGLYSPKSGGGAVVGPAAPVPPGPPEPTRPATQGLDQADDEKTESGSEVPEQQPSSAESDGDDDVRWQ